MGSYMAKGELCYTSLDYQNALEMYNNEIHKNPKSHLALLLKGNCLYKLNRQEEALKSYDKTLELNPNCIGALYNKGYIEYTANKNYSMAINFFEECIQKIESIDKNLYKYYYLYYAKGLCEFQLELYESALKSFLKSYELKQKNENGISEYLILNNIGRCYDKLKNYPKAIEYFINSYLSSDSKYYIALYNQAMSLLKIKTKKFEAKKIFESIYEDYNSDFAPAYYGLGLYYVALNEKKIALDYFNQCINIDSEFLDAYLRKGNCLHRLKRYTESIDCFDYVISRNPEYLNGIAFFNKGNSLKEIKRIEDAIECYLNAIKYMKKKDSDYFYNLSVCQFLSGKNNSALESVEKSIEINETWKNYYLKGIIMKKSKKKGFKEIIKLFNKSLEMNPEFCDNYYNKAVIFFNNKENASALNNIQTAIEKYDKTKKNSLENNDISDFYYLRGLIYKKMEKWDEAINSFDKAIELRKNFPECIYEKGVVYFEKTDYKRSMDFLDEALKLDPQNHFAYFKKGHCLLVINNFKEALNNFESAISINPKNGKYFYFKGKCLYELKRKNDAMYSFDKAIQIGTSNLVESYYYKGLSLYDLQILNEAKNSLIFCLKYIYKEYFNKKDINGILINDELNKENFINKAKNSKKYFEFIYESLYYIGLIDYSEKKYNEALDYFELSLKYNQKNDNVYYNKGLCYTSLNNEVLAIECYNESIKINPSNELAHFKLGKILYDQDKKEEAIQQFYEAFKANGNNYYATYNMAKCYMDLKKYENALEWFNQTLKIDKHYYFSWLSKGRVLYEMKKYNDAIESFKKSIQLNKNKSAGYYYMGQCYYTLKNNDEAKKFLDECIKMDSEHYRARFLLAKIYEKEKKNKEAIGLLKEALKINENYYEAQDLLNKLEDYY